MFELVVGGLIVAFVWAVIVGVKNQIKRTKDIVKLLNSLPDFTQTQFVLSQDVKTGLAFDEGRGKVCLIAWDKKTSIPEFRVFGLKDLLSTEIYEDGQAVTRTSRSSQLGSALVGGLLFGGLGAVVGGLSGKTVAADKVKSICLRVMVNDTARPIHEVQFLLLEVKRDSSVYKETIKNVRHWNSILEILIKRADQADKENQKQNQEAVQVLAPMEEKSLSEKLRELKSLMDDGILSQAEYESQKEKVLQG